MTAAEPETRQAATVATADPPAKLTVWEGMAQVTRAVDYIAKGTSSGVTYEFRSIDAVMNHLHGPLAEAGLFLAPKVLDDWLLKGIPGTNNRTQYQAVFRVEVTVWSADGTHVTLGPGLAQAHDYGDKAAYQAQQNAIKYLLLEAFCIPTAEPDLDGRQADDSPREKSPRDRISHALKTMGTRHPDYATLYETLTGILGGPPAEPAGWRDADDADLAAFVEQVEGIAFPPDTPETPDEEDAKARAMGGGSNV